MVWCLVCKAVLGLMAVRVRLYPRAEARIRYDIQFQHAGAVRQG